MKPPHRLDEDVLHGRHLDFAYGNTAAEGETFIFGSIQLTVLETPSHTFESISLAMRDTSTGDKAIGVFTGDTLFHGSVGRTDFFPDRA